MQHQPLHSGFTKQFRQQYIVYPCAEEGQYQQFYFRQFGKQDELTALGKLFVKKYDHSECISNLIIKLENEARPNGARLCGFAQKLIKVFSSYARKELYTACYYNRLLKVLTPFLKVVNTYQQKVNLELAVSLEAVFFKEGHAMQAAAFCSDDVEAVQAIVEEYIHEVCGYYDEFFALLRQESNNDCGVKLTSRIEQDLLKLIMLTERSMLYAEDTNARVKNWKNRLAGKEAQEMYN